MDSIGNTKEACTLSHSRGCFDTSRDRKCRAEQTTQGDFAIYGTERCSEGRERSSQLPGALSGRELLWQKQC